MSVSGCMRVVYMGTRGIRAGMKKKDRMGISSYFFVGKELMFLCGFA